MLATERDALKRRIEQEAGDPIDPARVRENLEDFQLLYEAATDEERAELLRLLIKEIVVEPAERNGPGRKIAIHFRATVNLPKGGSIYRQNWLPTGNGFRTLWISESENQWLTRSVRDAGPDPSRKGEQIRCE